MVAPKITASYDLDLDKWELYATSYGQCEPCGPRLFRSKPWPEIEFCHDNERDALSAAKKLQEYVDRAFAGKIVKSKGEEQDRKDEPKPEIKDAVWM